MTAAGYEQADFILVSGDAYVDHPSFGHAIIARTLERFNYKVAIIAQPSMAQDDDFLALGKPCLGFMVTAGNIDSMVNHYTVAKKRRRQDAYTEGGLNTRRPDRATIRYAKKIRELFGDVPIIIGGIEASLRRLAHYDYWDDALRRSILLDSGADLLVYGMAERTVIAVAEALDSGLDIRDLIFLKNTVWKTKKPEYVPSDAIHLPDYDTLIADKQAFVKSFQVQYKHAHLKEAAALVERYQRHFVIQNPREEPLQQHEMDDVYDLPFQRVQHPRYQDKIPALEEVRFSLTANRGCFGGCHFCALTFHQGKVIQSRSKASLVKEAEQLTADPDFKGYIHDVGGPTANFYRPSCTKQAHHGVCHHKACIGYEPCDALEVDHRDYLEILRTLRNLPKVKKVFVRSGVRYDYVLYDKDPTFFEELVEHHISGQLKIAPEHVDDTVLKTMGKPSSALYERFLKRYYELNERFNKQQFIVPYLMSSHPGSTLKSAIALAQYLKKTGQRVEQVQDFYPTPGTASTCMYYTGINPFTNASVHIPKSAREKAMQRALIQFDHPKNHRLVKDALLKAGRSDLIGHGPHCLIRP